MSITREQYRKMTMQEKRELSAKETGDLLVGELIENLNRNVLCDNESQNAKS